MKDISELKVTRVIVFRQDNFPAHRFFNKVASQFIQQSFNFQLSNPAEGGGYEFGAGLLVKGDRQIVVDNLKLEMRRITMTVSGDSTDADLFYEELIAGLKQIAVGFEPQISVISTQTSCVLTLSFPFTSLLDRQFIDFAKRDVMKATEREGRKHALDFRMFRMAIRYIEEEPEKHLVPIAPKEFIIEPRVDTEPSENRFFTLSPTESEQHFKLIESLEAIYKSTK